MDSDKGILGLLGPILRNVILVPLCALRALPSSGWSFSRSSRTSRCLRPPLYSRPHLIIFARCSATAGFVRSLWNNLVISGLAVALSLIVGVPAAYALGRYQFKGREDIAFTFLSFRFAPEILRHHSSLSDLSKTGPDR